MNESTHLTGEVGDLHNAKQQQQEAAGCFENEEVGMNY